MKKQLRRINFWIVLSADLLFLVGAHFLAYIIRFEGQLDSSQLANFRTVLPFLILIKLTIFYFFGLYRGMWRYTGLTDLVNVVKACTLSSFVIIGAIAVVNRFEGFSRSVFVLDGLLTFLLIGGVRITLRLFYQQKSSFTFALGRSSVHVRRKKLLIIGAGDAAEKVVREIKDNRELPYSVIGFLDDNPAKVGNSIHGIPVLASIAETMKLSSKPALKKF